MSLLVKRLEMKLLQKKKKKKIVCPNSLAMALDLQGIKPHIPSYAVTNQLISRARHLYWLPLCITWLYPQTFKIV